MEAFMELFGGYEILGLTVYKWGLLAAALVFAWKIGGKVLTRIKAVLDAYQKREEELQKALQQVAQYPGEAEQSARRTNKTTGRDLKENRRNGKRQESRGTK